MFSGNSKYLLVFSFGLLLSMMIALSLDGLKNMASIQHRLRALVNDAILEKLREMSVDYAQGYGIHKPEALQNFL